MNSIPVTTYKCGNCGTCYQEAKYAVDCCMPYHCDICGIETPRYRTRCESCSEKIRFEKATIFDSYDGYIYDDKSDKYFGDMEELFEYYHDLNYDATDDEVKTELPKYVYACISDTFEIDIDFALSNEMENHHENAEYSDLVELNELIEFIEQWNSKQTLSSISADYSKIVEVKENEV